MKETWMRQDEEASYAHVNLVLELEGNDDKRQVQGLVDET